MILGNLCKIDSGDYRFFHPAEILSAMGVVRLFVCQSPCLSDLVGRFASLLAGRFLPSNDADCFRAGSIQIQEDHEWLTFFDNPAVSATSDYLRAQVSTCKGSTTQEAINAWQGISMDTTVVQVQTEDRQVIFDFGNIVRCNMTFQMVSSDLHFVQIILGIAILRITGHFTGDHSILC